VKEVTAEEAIEESDWSEDQVEHEADDNRVNEAAEQEAKGNPGFVERGEESGSNKGEGQKGESKAKGPKPNMLVVTQRRQAHQQEERGHHKAEAAVGWALNGVVTGKIFVRGRGLERAQACSSQHKGGEDDHKNLV
jgi:hypothetical protein